MGNKPLYYKRRILSVKINGGQKPELKGDLTNGINQKIEMYKDKDEDMYSRGYYRAVDRLHTIKALYYYVDSAFWYWYAKGSSDTSIEIENGTIDSMNCQNYIEEAEDTFNNNIKAYGITNSATMEVTAKARGRADKLNNYRWSD